MVNAYVNFPKSMLDAINKAFNDTPGEEVSVPVNEDFKEFVDASKNKIAVINGLVDLGNMSASVTAILNRFDAAYSLTNSCFGTEITLVFEYTGTHCLVSYTLRTSSD